MRSGLDESIGLAIPLLMTVKKYWLALCNGKVCKKWSVMMKAQRHQDRATGVTGFNIWSMIVAIIGAVIVLWLYHMIAARR
jgi:hypothetical protein